MENFLEILMPVSMLVTAILLFVLNVVESKQEKEEAKLKEAKAAHEEIRRRWRETEEIK